MCACELVVTLGSGSSYNQITVLDSTTIDCLEHHGLAEVTALNSSSLHITQCGRLDAHCLHFCSDVVHAMNLGTYDATSLSESVCLYL